MSPSGSGFLLICTPGIKDVHVTFVILQHEGQGAPSFQANPWRARLSSQLAFGIASRRPPGVCAPPDPPSWCSMAEAQRGPCRPTPPSPVLPGVRLEGLAGVFSQPSKSGQGSGAEAGSPPHLPLCPLPQPWLPCRCAHGWWGRASRARGLLRWGPWSVLGSGCPRVQRSDQAGAP